MINFSSRKYTILEVASVIHFGLILFCTGALSAEENCREYPIGESIAIKHNDGVHSAQFSPDGKKVITASSDNTAKIYDLEIKKETIINHNGQVYSAHFSPDGKKVVTTSSDNLAKVYDLETKKDTIIKHNYRVNSAQFSPDGKKVVTASSDNSAKVYDLETKKETIVKHNDWVHSAQFSPDGKKVITVSLDKTVKVYDLETKKDTIINHSISIYSAQFSPDGKKVVTASSDNSAKVYDLETKKETIVKHNDWVRSAQFSPDGKKVVTTSSNTAKVYDLETKKETIINHNGQVYSAQFSPDGKKVVTSSWDKTAKIYDLETKKETIINHNGQIDSVQFSPDGKKVVTASSNTAKVYDLETKKETIINHNGQIDSVQFSPDGKKVVGIAAYKNMAEITDLSKICVNAYSFEKSKGFTPCSTNGFPNSHEEIKKLNLTMEGFLCSQELDEKSWDAYLGNPDKKLSSKAGELYLMRFQKPGGFQPEKHLAILLGALNSDLITKKPELILGAMHGVFYTSKDLYKYLTEQYPILLTLKAQKIPPCQTEKEKTSIQKKVKQYIDNLSQMEKFSFSTLEKLSPLITALTDLPKAEKDDLIDKISQNLADSAIEKEFKGHFLSKIYKLTTNAVSPLFGEPKKILTDFTILRGEFYSHFSILASDPIDGEEKTASKYGFYFKDQKPLYFSPYTQPNKILIEKTYSWKQKGENYKAELKITTGEKKEIIPIDKSPSYQSLWKDNKKVGLIMTGTNLRSDSLMVMNEYLSYYHELGYTFSEKNEEINTKQWLKKHITSGDIDYFIKEAHSDGDEKNLFRINEKSNLKKGIKKLENGKEEIVYLLFPTENSSGSFLLPNNEFGEWVRSREKAGGGQLVYFNTSCWSHSKAVHEIEAAASKTLLNIPSLTSVDTFIYHYNGAEYLLLSNFLQEKSYEEIRKELKNNPGYKSGKENVFIFPDEDPYRRFIAEKIAVPLKTELKITDHKGKPYSIEQEGY